MSSGTGDASDHAASSPEPARRQYLTVVFCDLSDSTQLGASMEAEHYADMLGDIRRAYRDVVPRHGGTIVRIQGDGMLAIFGHPEAREDDGRRATEAALDLHAAVRLLQARPVGGAAVALSLHTGIHAGLVLVDDGDLVRGRFELLGNAPNIAARLSAAAQRDEILVSEETLGAERHFFEASERRYLDLKGRAEPLAAYSILRRAPVRTRFEARSRRGLVAFVGRQRELDALEVLRRETETGRALHVVLSAPPGLGKTRLAEEFLRGVVARGGRVHRGYCESYLSAEPLQPFLQMLRALFGLEQGLPVVAAAEAVRRGLAAIHPGLLEHEAGLLHALSLSPPTPAIRATPPLAAASTVRALGDLFDALAADQPLVLFVDDWQWADDASRQVLDAIRTTCLRPILLLTSTRPEAVNAALRHETQVIELQPFDAAEAAHTITRLLPGVDPFVAAEIRRHAGGNALFLEELCHSAAHDRAAHRPARLPEGGAWLETLIESRVGRLPRAQREVVRSAAIIGNVIPAWLLEAVTGLSAHDPLLTELAEHDFLFAGERAGTLCFKHGITREVIYAGVGLHERRAMHLRVAIAMRERGAAGVPEMHEALAYHYGAGGSAAEAAHYAELAGDKAWRASALDRAQLQYRAALEALDPLGSAPDAYRRWMAIAHRLGLVCVFDPSRDHLDVLERAVSIGRARDDGNAVAQSEYWLGYIQYALGEPRVAIDHCEHALRAVGPQADDPIVVQIRATLGQARAAAGDYLHALPLLDEAIAVKQRHRSGSRPAVGLSYTLACKAGVLGDRGLFEPAQALFDEAIDAVRGANHEVEASVLGWRSLVYLWQGRWDEALRAAAEAQAMAQRIRSMYIFAMDQGMAARASWAMDPTPQTLQTLRDATKWLEAGNRRLNISLNHAWLAEAFFDAGQLGVMRHHAGQALARARRCDRLGQAAAYRTLARASAAAADATLTARYLALALRAARLRGSPHEEAATQLCAAELVGGRGDRALALAALDPAQRAFETMGMVWHQARAQRLRHSL
jgi:class 3 adenylate cyclase/tetratricopeptide (TPR) repeat protein